MDKKSIILYYAKKIRAAREAQGLKQPDMAAILEISTQAYSSIERGESNFNIVQAAQIAEKLGTSLEDLLSKERKIIISERQGGTTTLENNSELVIEVDKGDSNKIFELVQSLNKIRNTEIKEHFFQLINHFARLYNVPANDSFERLKHEDGQVVEMMNKMHKVANYDDSSTTYKYIESILDAALSLNKTKDDILKKLQDKG
jgi:transcriptional regulator with XRE-family HTH domain